MNSNVGTQQAFWGRLPPLLLL